MGEPAPGDVEFWYEFASTYSYHAAIRVEELAAESGLRWARQVSGGTR